MGFYPFPILLEEVRLLVSGDFVKRPLFRSDKLNRKAEVDPPVHVPAKMQVAAKPGPGGDPASTDAGRLAVEAWMLKSCRLVLVGPS